MEMSRAEIKAAVYRIQLAAYARRRRARIKTMAVWFMGLCAWMYVLVVTCVR